MAEPTIDLIIEGIGWTASWLKDKIYSVLESNGFVTRVHEVTMMEKLAYMLLFGGCAFLFTYIVTYFPRKVEKEILSKEQKLMDIRQRYKALQTNTAVLCAVNFGADKEVRIGAFTSDTKIEELRQAISMIEEAIDNEMEFTSQMSEYIEPFIKEVTGDGILPDELELEDALGLLKLFANYLEEKEPVRGRQPREEEIMDPVMMIQNKILRQILKRKKPSPLSQPRPSRSNTRPFMPPLFYIRRPPKVKQE